ncbi:MAG: PstS family phosphate ABC transporter substrate-binding protein [Bdellovibrionota bacterium]
MSFAEVHAQTTIKIDGSSTVFPITEAMAEEYQTAQKGKVRVTVGISGTGGGFKKFCKGETDIQNASRPIQTKELADCKAAGVKFLEIPVAYDATVVVVHKDNKLSEITTDELKKMWAPEAQGKVTNWKQVNAAWADQPLKLYGAGSDSGTFDYFTEAIVGKAKSSRGDYSASEDDNTLVNGVAGDKNALGYLPMAYYEMNKGKLKAVAVKSAKSGKGVLPSKATVEDGTYAPLSRPIFIYVNEASMKKTPAVKEFAEFYLKNAAVIVPQVKYVALPAEAYRIGQEHITKNKLGTVFNGHSDIGIRVEDLMKKEGNL